MIPILIAIIFVVIGMVIFYIVKDGAAYNSIKKFIATICALSPIIALCGLLLYAVHIELAEYKFIKDTNLIIRESITEMKLEGAYNEEIIEEAEKHNTLCESHYETYQKMHLRCSIPVHASFPFCLRK